VTSSKVARRYAQALLELAADQDRLEQWGAELERLAQTISSPELLPRLTSPELPDEQRLEAVTLVAARLELSFPLRSFAVVVARHGRLVDFTAIAQAYRDLLDRHLGRARAMLTFAAPPGDADLAAVVEALERLSGKKIIAQVNVDPKLIGGVVAELEGRTYDASVANQLEVLQRELSRDGYAGAGHLAVQG
jgi:F-type H+-transporting ATPase subunit delta